MQKTIRLLPLLLLARCSTSQVNQPPVGVLTNNDSPIRVTDTTTQPLEDQSKPQTPKTYSVVTNIHHQNRENPEHIHKDAVKKTYFVHDTDLNDTYRPACFVFLDGTAIVIPSGANDWQLSFANDSGNQFFVSWAKKGHPYGNPGDIAIHPINGFSDPAGGMDTARVVQVKNIAVHVDTLTDTNVVVPDPPTVTPPPPPALPPPVLRTLVTVSYCPDKGKCKNPCK